MEKELPLVLCRVRAIVSGEIPRSRRWLRHFNARETEKKRGEREREGIARRGFLLSLFPASLSLTYVHSVVSRQRVTWNFDSITQLVTILHFTITQRGAQYGWHKDNYLLKVPAVEFWTGDVRSEKTRVENSCVPFPNKAILVRRNTSD